jgi:hypothetical protein
MPYLSFIFMEVLEIEIDDREVATKRLAVGLKLFEVIDNP